MLAKQRTQWSVIGWVKKMYNLELLRSSEGTLSRWSQLHLQSFVHTPVSRRVDVRQAVASKKTIAESLSQHDENMLYRPYLVGQRKKKDR
jgi:hypothetical protein